LYKRISKEFAMRTFVAGIALSTGLLAAVAFAQNPPNNTPGQQPGAAGQKQGEPAGQGQFPQGQAVGQAIPGQPAQPARVGQPSAVAQPGAVVQPGQPGQFTQTGRLQDGQSGSSDQQIAAVVHGEANNEIEISKWAESKCTNDECREFTQRMVRDHTPGCEEMKRLAGNLATHGQGQSGRAAAGGHQGQLDWVAIKHQIGEQCLASLKKELGQKQGAEFDKCFMGHQIAAHMKVIDELKVLRNYASSDLQQKLDKEVQGAEQHLQLAKQIEHKLKENPSERVSRRPDSNK